MLQQAGFEIADADYGVVGAHPDYFCVKRRPLSR